MKLVGFVVVIVCVFAGYMLAGGKMAPILHALPFEGLTIIGAAVGAFIVANSGHTIKATIKGMNCMIKPEAHNKEDYIELMSVLYMVFKLARTKGWLALESHIENPEESELFKQFPGFHGNHHAIIFLCDYLRIISMGNENAHEIEALMDEEIETLEHEKMHPSHAIQTMADGIPALGIVAAVLGIIKTMGSITEPPEVLGKMIGGALVGTFLGVFLAYGFVGPIASALGTKGESEVLYYRCIKVSILSFLNGSAPQIAVEFSRKFLPHHVQPTFLELEEKLNELPSPG
ncbi:MAG: flagellar motor stator protein MotA [Alphaproteobacteria bacterium CG_4_9_14_3_um_filter_47_13]|nr:MAG: flagellar motor stator protein MotA [Alphaproteobacteria bacterium CG_4_9_14_3_um_filter_47_13]